MAGRKKDKSEYYEDTKIVLKSGDQLLISRTPSEPGGSRDESTCKVTGETDEAASFNRRSHLDHSASLTE